MRRNGRLGLALVILVAGLMGVALPAQADPIFDLTSDHCSGGCGPAGTIFGTVTVTQSGTSVNFDVHLNSPFAFANTGAVDGLAFKFNATGIVLSDITVTQTVPGQTLAAVGPGSFTGDGTGFFAWGIQCTTCGGGLSTAFTNDILFTIANATVADVTAANTSGNIFVADVGNTLTGATGPIDANHAVPEPGSLLFFGPLMALAWMVGVRRWKRQ